MESDRFTFIRNLEAGELGFLQLYDTVEAEPQQVAVKFLKRSCVNKYIEDKIVAHSLLKHKHIIIFKECLLSSEYVGIVLEYGDGGSLMEFVKGAEGGKLRESTARNFFQQLMSAVDYTERKGLSNRDLTMDNTLLMKNDDDSLTLKISDFAYSIHDFDSRKKSKETALPYMAPEVLMGDAKYDDKVADIWSCGVILYHMLFGTYPFAPEMPKGSPLSSSIKSLHDKEVNSTLHLPSDVEVSDEAKDLLVKMLAADPKRRITLKEVLQHPFYLKDLPEDEAHLNDEVTEEDVKHMKKRQSVLDIRSLLDFALA